MTMRFNSSILYFTFILFLSLGIRVTGQNNDYVEEEWVMEEKALISELSVLVGKLKGGDKRLLRHDALEHTHQARTLEGTCDKLYHALNIVADKASSPSDKTIFLVCEFATLCITDHPSYRTLFSTSEGVHERMIQLVSSPNPKVSAKAAHVIYIASFANKVNQETFFKLGAVEALSNVVKNPHAKPVQVMYSFAALQNLASNYCVFRAGTEDEFAASCVWAWKLDEETIVIDPMQGQSLLTDGSEIRSQILQDKRLVQVASQWSCRQPVKGSPSDGNIFPGYNAVSTGRDDDNEQIIPWAALGMLKNLALDPIGRHLVERSIPCFCHMIHSHDGLESSKAEDVLHHLRRESDPCWFDHDDEDMLVCVDFNFLDSVYNTCEDYENSLDEDCDTQRDIFRGVSARQACCECGGGYQLNINHDEL